MKNDKKVDIIAINIFLLDQIIKTLIQRNMNLSQQIKLIPNFLSLIYVKNTGAAFSILKDNTLLLIVISVLFLCILNYLIKKETNLSKLSIYSFGMIMGGVYGNLIDRIIHHAVIDYIAIHIFSYSFPIFNLADMGITIGVVILLITSLLERKQEKGEKNE